MPEAGLINNSLNTHILPFENRKVVKTLFFCTTAKHAPHQFPTEVGHSDHYCHLLDKRAILRAGKTCHCEFFASTTNHFSKTSVSISKSEGFFAGEFLALINHDYYELALFTSI